MTIPKAQNTYCILILLLFTFGCSPNTNNTQKQETTKFDSRGLSDALLKESLELIAAEDQTFRSMLPGIRTRFEAGSKEEQDVQARFKRQDSLCLAKTLNIIDKHGWLGKSRMGIKGSHALWLVIQHADLEIQEKYLPLLKKSVQEGESEGWHVAYLEDRILMRRDQNQVYGTQAFLDKKSGHKIIYPIDDVKNVNKRREAVGLETIEQYAEMSGYIFDQKN